LSFSGYLLPWDQLSYWAVTVGTNLVNYVPAVGRILRDLLLGGAQIGQATLLRFYALHVVVLPLTLTVLLALHIWRVRKDGFAVQQPTSGAFAEQATERPSGPAAPIAGGADVGEQRVRLLGVVDRQSVTAEERRVDDTVFTWPHLLVRHVVVGLATAAVVLTLGVAFAAPLRGLANPNLTPEPSKAPWYFVGLQELLSHVDPLVAGVLIPLGTILGLALLPYLDRNPATEARNRKVAVLLFATLLVIAAALTIIGVFFRGPGWRFVPPWRHLYVEL
jgi:quinol-cytochrome oxidoreductase complex cytochrome b subunit